jgi:hypothetical protein
VVDGFVPPRKRVEQGFALVGRGLGGDLDGHVGSA